jgi:hypothetical protein
VAAGEPQEGAEIELATLAHHGVVDQVPGEAARQASPPPSDPAKRRFWRGDAAQNMTDAEYGIWRREKRNGSGAVALATSLKLKDEDT